MTPSQCVYSFRCLMLFYGIHLSLARSVISKEPVYVGDLILPSDGDTYLQRNSRDALHLGYDHIIRKRQIINPNNFRNKLWDMPLKYKLDPAYDNKNVDIISKALKEWETDTCLKFQMIPFDQAIEDYHLIFEKASTCSSDLGRTPGRGPKFIKLSEESCKPFKIEHKIAIEFGFVLHQMGHVLGYLHEQSRTDSRDFVTILDKNIKGAKYAPLFHPLPNPNAITSHTPYDYGSVMHYAGNSLAKPGTLTIKANDPLFQKSMGQRNSLSFYDIKKTNLAYCKDTCSKPITCEKGGIPNPNNCNVCICPDGYGGTNCQTVGNSDPGCKPNTNTVITVSSASEECLESPHYGSGVYDVESECNWILKAPEGKHIQLHFSGDFSVFEKETVTCFHWVEIKFKKNLDIAGPRFCGNDTPKETLTTEGNQAVISFRSKYEAPASSRGGFQLCYKLKQTGGGNVHHSTSPPSILTTKKSNSKSTTKENIRISTTKKVNLISTTKKVNLISTTKKVNSISTTIGPNSCPSGQIYSLKAACKATCARPNALKTCSIPQVPGCMCPKDRYLFRDICVKRSACKCVDFKDEIRKKGDTWLSRNCKRKITCQSMGQMRSRRHRCPTGQRCRRKKYFGSCIPKTPA